MVLGWLPISQESKTGSFTPTRALAVLRQYADLGIDEVLIATSTLFPDGPDADTFAQLKWEVIVPVAAENAPTGR